MVKASSSACVGCSCAPSPALTIAGAADARQLMRRARRRMADDDAIRRHRFQIPRRIEQRLAFGHAGSRSADIDGVGAERRLAAISKEVRVRVEGSKKRLMTVRPRSVGTFLISRREMSRKDSAVSRMCVISAADSSRMPSRSLAQTFLGLRAHAKFLCRSLLMLFSS